MAIDLFEGIGGGILLNVLIILLGVVVFFFLNWLRSFTQKSRWKSFPEETKVDLWYFFSLKNLKAFGGGYLLFDKVYLGQVSLKDFPKIKKVFLSPAEVGPLVLLFSDNKSFLETKSDFDEILGKAPAVTPEELGNKIAEIQSVIERLKKNNQETRSILDSLLAR